jgi:hypothetical protein
MCGSSTTQTTAVDPTTAARQAGVYATATGTPQVTQPAPPKMFGMSDADYQQFTQQWDAAHSVNPIDGASPIPTSYTPFTGQMVAGLTPDQQTAFQSVRDTQNIAQPGLLSAANMATQAGGYQPSLLTPQSYNPATAAAPGAVNVTAPSAALSAGAGGLLASPGASVSPQNVSAQNVTAQQWSDLTPDQQAKYLNPFTQNVVNTSLSAIDQARQQAVNAAGAKDIANGAFGGSRSGVAQALTNQVYGQQSAATAAALNQAGYENAQQTFGADANRALTAGQGNQQANLTAGVANENAGVQAGIANTGNNLQASLANASMTQNNNQFNAGAQNAAGQFGASLAAQLGTANAGLLLNNNQFNAGAHNAAGQFNASQVAATQAGNANNGLTANGQSLQAAGLLGNISQAQQTSALTGANALAQAGATQQGTQQATDNAAYQQWVAAQQYPAQYLQLLQSLQGTPGQVSTTTQNQSPLATILGGATSLAGLLFPGAGGAAAGAGGLLGGGIPASTIAPTLYNG